MTLLGRHGSIQAITRLACGSPVTDICLKIDGWGNVISGSMAGNSFVLIGSEGYWLDADLIFVVGSGGAAGHLAVRGKNLSRMVGTYGGGGSLREQFHLDRQESVIALTGLYGNNPATDLRNKFNAFGERIWTALN